MEQFLSALIIYVIALLNLFGELFDYKFFNVFGNELLVLGI